MPIVYEVRHPTASTHPLRRQTTSRHVGGGADPTGSWCRLRLCLTVTSTTLPVRRRNELIDAAPDGMTSLARVLPWTIRRRDLAFGDYACVAFEIRHAGQSHLVETDWMLIRELYYHV